MAKSKEKKSELDLKKAIADAVEEEIKVSTGKQSKKTTKKTGKITKKKIVKAKDSKKNAETSTLQSLSVNGKRSRKKKTDFDENNDINSNDVLDNNKVDNVDNVEKVVNDNVIDDKKGNMSTEGSEKITDVFDINDDIENVELENNDKKETDKIEEEQVKETNVKSQSKPKHIPKLVLVGIAVVAILVFAIIIATKTMKTVIPNVASINSISDLNNKLDAKLVSPKDAKNLQYGIEGNGVARMDYARVTTNGTMNLVFRMSKDPDADLYGETHKWGERVINIDVVCEDGAIINVESFESLDDNLTLIALWKDNNEYYSLFTKNVSTREDFYREVNQLVIANHKAEK